MTQTVTVKGIVIGSFPIGEYDKRLVILSAEWGKMTVFARGARRTTSPLLGATTLFALGTFELNEGRSAYSLRTARIAEHFTFLSEDPESLCYASYFAELAQYYAQENVESSGLVALLYAAFHALKNPQLPHRLARAVFELKCMQMEGEYFEKPRLSCGDSAAYAWAYVLDAPPKRCFSFLLEGEAKEEFTKAVEDQLHYFVDREFHSLKVLEAL